MSGFKRREKMGLRIKTNIASLQVQKQLRQADKSTSDSFQKLASGKRITKSADDAAGLAIATKMKAEVRGLKMAERNANDGISMIQVAEGGLEESSNILTRMRELSIQAASDTVGEKERGYLNMEYDQLVQEVDRISKTTTYSGRELLTGEGGELDFHVGAYAGDENKIGLDADKTNATSSGLGIEGTGITSKGDAADNLEKIDEAIDKVSGFRANLGAVQSRLQTTVSNLGSQTVNTEAARSRIEDTDIAAESAKLASNNVVKSAATATLSQANNIGNSALRLIG
jgi:flagellin